METARILTWLAFPVVRLSKLLEKVQTKKGRINKMAREARHFVDEAVLLRIFGPPTLGYFRKCFDFLLITQNTSKNYCNMYLINCLAD